MEILYISSAYGHSGHIAVRIGQTVFHADSRGTMAISMDEFVNDEFSGHHIEGVQIQAEASVSEMLRDYLQKHVEEKSPFSIILSNCSQVVCRGLREAGFKAPRGPMALDPSLAITLFKRSSLAKGKVEYNLFGQRRVIMKKIRHRAKALQIFIGIPTIIAAGTIFDAFMFFGGNHGKKKKLVGP